MGVLFFDTFDSYNPSAYTSNGACQNYRSNNLVGNTYSIDIGGTSFNNLPEFKTDEAMVRRWLGGNHNTVSVCTSTYMQYEPTQTGIYCTIMLENNGTPQIGLKFGPTTYEIIRFNGNDSTGVVLGSAARAPGFNAVQFIVKIGTTDGSCKLLVQGNNSPLIDLTNVNTQGDVSATTVDTVRFGTTVGDIATGGFSLYSLHVTDDLNPGPFVFVETLPLANDVLIQFDNGGQGLVAPQIGNLQLYNYSKAITATAVNKEIVCTVIPTTNGTASSVAGVMVVAVVGKTGISRRKVVLTVKSGASTAQSTPFVLVGLTPSEGRRLEYMFLTDPATGLAWTSLAVSTMQVGIKIVE